MKFVFFIFLVISSLLGWSQDYCGTTKMNEVFNEEHTTQRNDVYAIGRNKKSEDSLPHFVVPVVVHIVHLGESIGVGKNLSDATIHRMMDSLNADLNNINTNQKSNISYKLATVGPDGCPTTGITRTNGLQYAEYAQHGLQYYSGSGLEDAELMLDIGWPPRDYYNIVLVHKINSSNISAYAYYPNNYYFDASYVSMNHLFDKTVSHEVGHGLYLYHTFEGDGAGSDCPANGNCNYDGDKVCDTPPHKRTSCNKTSPLCDNSAPAVHSVNNIMSYCHSDSAYFTEGQMTRMNEILQGYSRKTLINNHRTNVCGFYITANITNELCNQKSDGRIELTPSCELNQYSYQWHDENITSSIRTNLPAGDYWVTVIDSNLNSLDTFITVGIQKDNEFEIEVEDNLCFGEERGSILVDKKNIQEPLVVYINGVEANQSIPNLASGTYSVYIKDFFGCITDTQDIEVGEPLEMLNEGTFENACDSCNGKITLNIVGGVKPYIITHNGSVSPVELSGLCAGGYSFLIQDSNFCFIRDSITIQKADPLTPFFENFPGTQILHDANPITIIGQPKGGIMTYNGEEIETFLPSDTLLGYIRVAYRIIDSLACTFEVIDSFKVVYNPSNINNNTPYFVYPNPASNAIKVMNFEDELNYFLINNLGQNVKSGIVTEFKNEIDVQGLTKGSYILRIKDGETYIEQKIVVGD
ncbi:MAG: T9SS type A sorting domain-containing protein [Bacteroidia bacterium]|nr:T9SS type A sorting domain-containing protein [Bacteroidia bacterium]